jgi:hypothetical protein
MWISRLRVGGKVGATLRESRASSLRGREDGLETERASEGSARRGTCGGGRKIHRQVLEVDDGDIKGRRLDGMNE